MTRNEVISVDPGSLSSMSEEERNDVAAMATIIREDALNSDAISPELRTEVVTQMNNVITGCGY